MKIKKRKQHSKERSLAQVRMSLVTIVSLILVGIFLLLFFKVGAGVVHIFSKGTTSQGVKEVPLITNDFFFLEGANQGEGIDRTLSLHKEDLYLFFSAGNTPIRLHKKGSNSLSDDLIFLRPNNNACDGKACLCYCGAGPYWDFDKKQISYYLKLGQPYTCPKEALTCQTFDDETAVFGNSRGWGHAFSDSVVDKVKQYNNNKQSDLFYPVPFDIVLLGQDGFINTNSALNAIFPTKLTVPTNRYDAYFQRIGAVEHFTNDYQWKGGVAIGGSLTPAKKEFKTTSAMLRIEKTIVKNMYGVCLHSQCIFNADYDITLADKAHTMDYLQDFFLNFQDQQQKSFHSLSITCFNHKLSTSEQETCKKQLSTIAFTYSKLQASLLRDKLIFSLNFTYLHDNLYNVTLQALFPASCTTPDYIEIVHAESFIVNLPIRVGTVPNANFLMLERVDSHASALSPTFYITTDTPATLCQAIGLTPISETLIQSLAKPYTATFTQDSTHPNQEILLFSP